MPKKNSFITVTDQFCGAGGSSQGASTAGAEIKLALNHWALAIETHNTNFPNTLHECTDISACNPRRYPSTDILITSPECTNHSLAKGRKAVTSQMDMFNTGVLDASAERSRATMWDVPRFAEYHSYNAIIVENVVDARRWVLFDAWLSAMHALGYSHKCVYFNSRHFHPTPQTRDRMYVNFWKTKNKAPQLDYSPLAYCPSCKSDVYSIQTWKNQGKKSGKYKQQYVYCCPVHNQVVEPYYYAAYNCIDWSNIGKRIEDRKTPLSSNTVKRINHGLAKYGSKPILVHNFSNGYSSSVHEPTGTITTVDKHALLTPFLVHNFTPGYTSAVTAPTGTITTSDQHALLVPPPMVILNEHTKSEGYVRSVAEPVQTQATRQTLSILTPPQFIQNGKIDTQAFNAFIHYNYGQTTLAHISDPMGACTTVGKESLVTYKEPTIEECYYRMLKPDEIKLAMAFDKDYKVVGSGKVQVKQLGNAVTPPVMKWIVQQVIQSLS